MNYEEALTAQAEKSDKAQLDEQNAKAWHKILDRWPLRDSQANYGMLLQWANPLTLEPFEELLRTKPAGLELDAISREQFIQDIVQQVGGDAKTKRDLAFRLSTFSLGQLRQRAGELAFKKTVRTKEQAKAYVASQRDPEPHGYNGTGFPRLAATLVPPGEIKAVNTGDFLRKIARSDVWLLKRDVRIYGSQQCEHFLNNA